MASQIDPELTSTADQPSSGNPAPLAAAYSSFPTKSVVITNLKLTGPNYFTWSRAMEMIITSKGKENHILDIVIIPPLTDPNYRNWKVENSTVMSWLIGSMTPEIAENFILYSTAGEIWTATREMYSKLDNTAELYELEAQLHEIKQGDSTVSTYYSQLKKLWQQIDMYENHTWPSPDANKMFRQIVETKRVFRFLCGLNRELDCVLGRLLGTKPLPGLNSVFSEVRHEESRLKVMLGPATAASVESSAIVIESSTRADREAQTAFYSAKRNTSRGGRGTSGTRGGFTAPHHQKRKTNLSCNFCKKLGHTIDEC